MKKTLCFLALVLLSVSVLFGQAKTGTLKIFTEVPGTVLYLDEVKQEDGTKVITNVIVGSHYLKALSNGTAIYGEIVEIKIGEVTTVLIKGVSNKTGEKPIVKPIAKQEENTGVVTYNPNSNSIKIDPPTDEPDSYVPKEELLTDIGQVINIGQVDGKLSPDMDGIFGLAWGMDRVTASNLIINQLGGVYIGQGKGFITFSMDNNTQKPFFLEIRLLDDKLFNIIVGYVAIDLVQQKVDKLSIPVSDYNEINETLLSTYGQPTTIQRDFTGGYKDGDGREVEAIKKHQATIKTAWIIPNGNVATLMIAYTKAMVVGVGYEYAPLLKEAHDKKIKINNYQY
jgi:hypothetical protein